MDGGALTNVGVTCHGRPRRIGAAGGRSRSVEPRADCRDVLVLQSVALVGGDQQRAGHLEELALGFRGPDGVVAGPQQPAAASDDVERRGALRGFHLGKRHRNDASPAAHAQRLSRPVTPDAALKRTFEYMSRAVARLLAPSGSSSVRSVRPEIAPAYLDAHGGQVTHDRPLVGSLGASEPGCAARDPTQERFSSGSLVDVFDTGLRSAAAADQVEGVRRPAWLFEVPPTHEAAVRVRICRPPVRTSHTVTLRPGARAGDADVRGFT